MASYTKTASRVLLAHQEVSHPNSSVGTALVVSNFLAADVVIYHANIETTANASGVRYEILGSVVDSGNEDWVVLASYTTSTAASSTANLTATEPVGETNIAVDATSGIVAGEIVYIKDATPAESEWAYVEYIESGSNVHIEHGLTVAKTASDDIFSDAEVVHIHVELDGIQRIQGRVTNHISATGSNFHCKMLCGTLDALA